jgi:hypothetical protein
VELLIEDIELKKNFQAKWPFDCEICGEGVEEDGDFIFMGDKKKVCSGCHEKIIDYLNEILEQEA